jgi:hypothetical protein
VRELRRVGRFNVITAMRFSIWVSMSLMRLQLQLKPSP